MNAVRAIFENGVFRPLEAVDFPEACEVVVSPLRHPALRPQSPEARAAVMEILGQRYSSGETDVAERHNEHQP